ncbi:beta-chimaerin isoform X2 [Nilaparvata lugens]|uniref:beta-chimaerin isoform X2 n=1 Tax=Nilaparvata lugens TaxID=108931 RepID=UPI00193DA3C1|nr:beta-chimaerin isoform X2 [Nilaparvata lugens]
MEANTWKDGVDTQTVVEPSSPVCPVWKPDLYKLQQEAPRPHAVSCQQVEESHATYGAAFHGAITQAEESHATYGAAFHGAITQAEESHATYGAAFHGAITQAEESHATYGAAFHGAITQAEARRLLRQEGDYLVRISSSNSRHEPVYTLSLRFNSKLSHYKLYYDETECKHYVGSQRFDTLDDLVAHGLVTLYIELHAGPYITYMCDTVIYEKSPAYLTLNRLKKRAAELLDGGGVEGEVDYDKPHAFRVHTFKGLNWCEFCGNFLWGFTAQGVKCDDCGLSAHAKCGARVPADCCPRLKQMRGVFGVDLTSLLKVQRRVRPFVVDKCVREVDARGLTTEGIYRVSGFQEEIDALRVAFNRDGENADVSVSVYENISVIAGALKLYLRLLPIPLITYDAHPSIITAVQMSSLREQKKCLKDALTLLLPAHYNTLKYLIFHLARVVEHQKENKMSSQSLSTVFAPTLMPIPDLTKYGSSLPDLSNEIAAIQLLIDHCYEIFS